MAVTRSTDAADGRTHWSNARLIPTYGIRTGEEQEKRATSCLLAVMRAVPEFGHALLKELGAPRSQAIQTFAEVRFKDPDGRTVIPDGAIVCERGKKSWTCLVEVKTARNELRPDQVGVYLDIAREQGFDGVLTISNQITPSSTDSPVQVDGRKLKKTSLWHFSWWRVITEAVVQSRHRTISDPDQAWILDELIAYFDNPASGLGQFEDMGDAWVPVRKAARDGTMRSTDPQVKRVAERWQEFVEFVALGLSQDLGRSVICQRPRKQTTSKALEECIAGLVGTGTLEATLRVPDAVGPVRIEADLKSRQTRTSVTLDAPGEGRARGRIGWILRQLHGVPDDLRLGVVYPNAREPVAALLDEAREAPERLLFDRDPKRDPRMFTLTLTRAMGQKRGKDAGSFVRETRNQAIEFYGDVVQNLKSWQPRAPRLPRDDGAEASPDDPESQPEAAGEPAAVAASSE
jgi:hypothetical protein